MKPLAYLFIALLQTGQTQGFTPETKFVKLGTDIRLDVEAPFHFTPKNDLFFWKYNSSFAICRSGNASNAYIYPDYMTRVTLLRNFSLILKCVKELDGGHYAAVLVGTEKKLAEYKVHVQAAVSPVKLEVASLRTDSCNFTVICSTNKAHVNATFGCHNNSCDQDGGELPDGDWRLGAFFDNSSIVCEHSNRVSERRELKALQEICLKRGESNGSSPLVYVLGAGAVAVAVAVATVCYFLIKGNHLRRRKRRGTIQKVQDVPQELNPEQTMDAIYTCDEANTTYSLVKPHTGPCETVYTQVVKPAKPQRTLEADRMRNNISL